ncbi:MAG: sulfatase-like hydrolase/transferase [Marinilabiliaceae bacterium]|nr:sulfatase-like hydrolase/transferase [Marinilabiliaceae bacterium]
MGDHNPNGSLRGGKYSLFEAGTRVPLITYWKGKIQPQKSDALICQVDLLASIAKLVGSDQKNEDIAQQNNVAEKEPEKLKEMIATFKTLRGNDYRNTQKLELK